MDKNPSVSSAALVSALTIYSPATRDTIKRWGNEVTESVNGSKGASIVQYHGIALLFTIKSGDRMSVSKLVQTYAKGLRSPFAHCLLVRYAVVVLEESSDKYDISN